MHDPGSTCCHTETAVLYAKGLRKTYGGRAVVEAARPRGEPPAVAVVLGRHRVRVRGRRHDDLAAAPPR